MSEHDQELSDSQQFAGHRLQQSSDDTAAHRADESIQAGDERGAYHGVDGHDASSASAEELTATFDGSAHDLDDSLVSAAEPPWAVGTTTEYVILSQVAYGGMGVIYRARDPLLKRDVAIKVLRSDLQGNPEIEERFVNESRIMSGLQHPGVAPVYDCGTCGDGRPYHAMKLVQGQTLKELLRQTLQQHQTGLLHIFAHVCETLAYAHAQGVVHLDLKPSNVMVGAFGEVHVMDWGLARLLTDSGKERTESHSVVDKQAAKKNDGGSEHVRGTPAYMSPEQARGSSLDARADVFGLGAILCEILTGRPPYRGDSPRQLYLRAVRGVVSDALTGLEACETDHSLVRLTKRCLAYDADDRPADAGELAHEVASYHESALELVEGDMERFFELSLDLFCIAGFDGYFRRINANFSRVLGYSDQELLSRPFLDFVHVEDHQQTIEQMGVLLEGQPVVRFRNRYITTNGKCIQFEWTAKSIPGEQLIFAVARDVT